MGRRGRRTDPGENRTGTGPTARYGRLPLGVRGRVLLAGLAVALISACTSGVHGSGTFGGSPPARVPDRAAAPACAGATVIAPAGAPYCYAVPPGFTDVTTSTTVSTNLGNESFRSAVAIAEHDLIIVSVYALREDTDTITDANLTTEIKSVLAQLSPQGVSFDMSRPRRSTVDGARAFGYHQVSAETGLAADNWFIFRGWTEIQVVCQWSEQPARITAGCGQLLGSLKIKPVK
jgi:hypothetical protein